MRISRAIPILALASIAACAAHPPRPDLSEMSGKQLYAQLCTSCHGRSGKGDGPMAPMLKIDVPDLTRIAHRNAGNFPAEQVKRTIDGRYERPAHGLPYMPVWGLELQDRKHPDDAAAQARGDAMIDRLVGYLRSIQER